jgi:hypothetical protein
MFTYSWKRTLRMWEQHGCHVDQEIDGQMKRGRMEDYLVEKGGRKGYIMERNGRSP